MILAAFEHWGVEEAVGRFNGMFVIVCWDTRERRLHLMRDPLGIKPLYLGLAGRTLLWGSELKALQAHPSSGENSIRTAFPCISDMAMCLARYRSSAVRKLPPGCLLTLSSPGGLAGSSAGSGRSRRWPQGAWPIRSWAATRKRWTRWRRPCAEASGLQMVADVPLGAFLSGGMIPPSPWP